MGGAADTTAAMDAAAQIRQANLRAKTGLPGLIQNRKVFGVAMFACLGGLLYGYNQSVFSGVSFAAIQHVVSMSTDRLEMGDVVTNQTKKGWLTSILELGAWFGALYSGPLCERYSRKFTILANVCVFCIGVVIQLTAIANNGGSSKILGGRFVTGMGVGSLSMSVPMYDAQIAPPEVRGSLVAMQQLAITFGIMLSFYASAKIMPFSPRWLVHHDREEEAIKVLTSLRELPADDPVLQLELLEIKAQSIFEKRTEKEKFPHLERTNTWSYLKLEAAGYQSLFTSWPMFRRVMVATGILSSLYRYNNTTSLLATGVVGIAMFIATIPAVIWVDRHGRKPVLIVGAIGMAVCHFIIAGIFAENENQWDSHQAAGWGAVAMVWLFVVHFGYSWGPCSWIIIAEIWPLSVRSKGTSLGASANWMNNFIVGQVTLDMLQGIRYGTYIFFGLITSLGAAFVFFLVPETKQLSLEEMDVIFGNEGTAAADFDRQAEISREIVLDMALARFADRHGVEYEGVEEKVN
ncbi:general substrate transporter [Aspergillus cavernicola]|uniref:General substrate transporter n=1 Tax=Aspergillus cavernicola TaxID=176166 RepID=A0ABR4I5X8_9EURO